MRKKLKLIDGTEVRVSMRLHELAFDTDCTRKYALVDMETGEVFMPKDRRRSHLQWNNRSLGLDFTEADAFVVKCLKLCLEQYDALKLKREEETQASITQALVRMRERQAEANAAMGIINNSGIISSQNTLR